MKRVCGQLRFMRLTKESCHVHARPTRNAPAARLRTSCAAGDRGFGGPNGPDGPLGSIVPPARSFPYAAIHSFSVSVSVRRDGFVASSAM